MLSTGSPSQLLPAREQMAFTLGFHIILVPFGVAFTFLMMAANYRGIRKWSRPSWSSPPSPCCTSCSSGERSNEASYDRPEKWRE
jgi:hypothetical protein